MDNKNYEVDWEDSEVIDNITGIIKLRDVASRRGVPLTSVAARREALTVGQAVNAEDAPICQQFSYTNRTKLIKTAAVTTL